MVKPTSVKDVDQHEIVRQIAGFLKKSGKVKVPEWSDLVKLGITKELAPVDSDWYYVRTASVARRLYIRSPTGVGALRRVYGSNKRRGVTPNHFARASGSVIRKALQTLEAIKWVEKHPDGNGRILTKQGRKDLDRIASQMRQNTKITLEP
uniref:40S ribosomal protein S19S n=1 Tax=Ascaris lumbricoides TaxID=6252 RepID=A0A9J2PDM1_ASCLU